MRKLSIILTLLSLAFSGVASAVEYKTVLANTPGEWASVSLKNTDVVEIVSHGGLTGSRNNRSYIKIEFEEGTAVEIPVGNAWDGSYTNIVGHTFTSATKISCDHGVRYMTLKITNVSEINKAGPTTVLVLPENSTGNYDLVVESSTDSITWIPFHSETVNSDTAERLFRVRIVHKGQEEAKAKAEEK